MDTSGNFKFGLIGYPLGHSFSKDYFTQKFKQAQIPASYENFPIENIAQLQQLADTPGLVGLNVTLPYKQSVIPFLHALSPEAMDVGAVNTILLKEGQLIGYNTDVHGCAHTLLGWLELNVRQALILGTGGAARAVAYVLNKMGIDSLGVSRTPDKGDLTYTQLTSKHVHAHQLIVNATPLGTSPNITECPQFPYDFLTPNHYLFDLVYNPEKTLFLKRGEERGARTKNGIEMLHLQADRAWEIWKSYLNTIHGS